MSKFSFNTAGLFAAAFLALVGFSNTAAAQSDTVDVTATLREAVTVTTATDVSFGLVDVNLAGTGTLTLNPDGSFTASGTDIVSAGSGTVSAGQINITGSNGINIDVSCSAATVSNAGGETVATPTTVSLTASATGTACAGVGTAAVTASLSTGSTSVFMGAQLALANMGSVTTTGAFATTNPNGVASILQATYQ